MVFTSDELSRNVSAAFSGRSGLARKSLVGMDSSSASAPLVPVTSTALCVATIKAAFFFRQVFAASAR